jgi:hypothetical protein
MPIVIGEILLAFFARAGVFLLRFAAPALVQIALTFGVSMVTYNLGTGPFVGYIQTALGGTSALVISILAGLNFDKAVTIILSAHITRYASRVVFRRTS